ncbi:MAG: glycogen/starch synthase [Candidatus Woesearchaeota archaeon]|jgi:ADP-glucose type glycogen/starch synthase
MRKTLIDLTSNIDTYKKLYLTSADKKPEEIQLWNKIEGGINQIISNKRSPYISKKLQRPIVCLLTPEIISLPDNMGNLAQIISTSNGGGGGLADISGALATELNRLGVNVHVAMPEYKHLLIQEAMLIGKDYEIIKRELKDDSKIHLISDGIFESTQNVYDDPNLMLNKVQLRKAMAFSRAIIYNLFPKLKSKNKNIIVHANDWMTALPVSAAKSQGMGAVMTFHNGFTYAVTPREINEYHINVKSFYQYLYFRDHPDKHFGSFDVNYHHNRVDLMASALFAADRINTVSPTYLKEIINDYFLDPPNIVPDKIREIVKIRFNQNCASGILNAPSADNDPRYDKMIKHRYWYEKTDDSTLLSVEEGKRKNKLIFQKNANLNQDPDAPLLFWPSRISEPQKGFFVFNETVYDLIRNFNLQIAVVAVGDENLINNFKSHQFNFPGRVSYVPFSRILSQMGKAGSDFIIMPSLYEPCGIPQLECPKYGTFPIVRRTGGLADTIEEMNSEGSIGNGFLFENLDKGAIYYGVKKAMDFYNKGQEFRTKVAKRVMRESAEKFNITRTAKQYIDVYTDVAKRNKMDVKII